MNKHMQIRSALSVTGERSYDTDAEVVFHPVEGEARTMAHLGGGGGNWNISVSCDPSAPCFRMCLRERGTRVHTESLLSESQQHYL